MKWKRIEYEDLHGKKKHYVRNSYNTYEHDLSQLAPNLTDDLVDIWYEDNNANNKTIHNIHARYKPELVKKRDKKIFK
jgi:3-methyladenine DNA glycosylase AlkC